MDNLLSPCIFSYRNLFDSDALHVDSKTIHRIAEGIVWRIEMPLEQCLNVLLEFPAIRACKY